MISCGRTVSHRSTSISPNGSFSGKRIWNSAFCRPGTVPNRFFTAHDMPVITWVLTLGRSMTKSASRTGRDEAELLHPHAVRFTRRCLARRVGQRAVALAHRQQAAGLIDALHHSGVVQPAGGIRHGDTFNASPPQRRTHGVQHGGVGGDGLFGRVFRHQVRLHKHAAARAQRPGGRALGQKCPPRPRPAPRTHSPARNNNVLPSPSLTRPAPAKTARCGAAPRTNGRWNTNS